MKITNITSNATNLQRLLHLAKEDVEILNILVAVARTAHVLRNQLEERRRHQVILFCFSLAQLPSLEKMKDMN